MQIEVVKKSKGPVHVVLGGVYACASSYDEIDSHNLRLLISPEPHGYMLIDLRTGEPTTNVQSYNEISEVLDKFYIYLPNTKLVVEVE